MSSNRQHDFKPTTDMIRAAELVFMAMALHQATEEVVRGYQRQILQDGQWHIDPKWTEMGHWQDTVILDPKSTFLLSDADFNAYLALCEQERVKRGLTIEREGNCPLCEAESTLREARRNLVDTMQPITNLSTASLLTNMELYGKAVELCLNLLGAYVDPHKTFGIPKVQSAAAGA